MQNRSISRSLCLSLGLAILAVVWLGPLPQLARQAFFAHMLMHMGVVAVAAPLLALAVAGGRFDLARKAPWLFSPIHRDCIIRHATILRC
jgi:putative membrane protein